MRLRSSLFLLALTAVVPLLALALLAVGLVLRAENSAIVDGAKVRNRATLEAVDAELRGTLGTLQALATSDELARGDYKGFQREAAVFLASQPHWQNVVLHGLDGRQLANARVPWGTPLPQQPIDTRSLQAAMRGSPAVSDILFTRTLQAPGVSVRVPVLRDGQVREVLTAVMRPSTFQQILERQRLPEDWVSDITGADGRIIARVPEVEPGRPAPEEFRRQAAAAAEGWYRGRTLEGKDAYTGYTRSHLSGWTISYAIPAHLVVGDGRRAGALVTLGVLMSIVAATLLGVWLNRRIAEPIAALSSAAAHLRTWQAPPAPVSAIHELQVLACALGDAAAAIQQRDAELVRRGEELARQADALRQVDANKTRFLAQVSHELRGPLGTLGNALHAWQGSEDPLRREQAKALMVRQVKMLTRMVGDLIDIGRIGRGELQLHIERVALDGLVQDCVDAVMPQVQDKQQTLVVRNGPLPVLVDGDADRLCQVITNLLTNANRYTPRGGHIEVRVAQEEGGEAVIAVADDGVGFTPADGVRLFDMFVRLAQAHAGEPGSLGIGLAVTRAIVEMHDGRLEAASDGPGRGATFTVRLPLRTAEASMAGLLPSSAPLAGA